MPRYDYKCLECEEIFEVEHSINAPALEECLCKDEKFLVERLPSKPMIVINDKSSMTDTKLYKELDIDK
tara:strand:- start:713 stop:919 length:207 start_codon:yes stop_codon:yes gene_type:complete